MPEQPRGYIFQNGQYTAPNYGSGAVGASPLAQPITSFDQTSPTARANQLTDAFTRNMQQQGPNWTAQGAMNFWQGMRPLYQSSLPMPQLLQQVDQAATQVPRYASAPMPQNPQAIHPPATGDTGLAAPRPAPVDTKQSGAASRAPAPSTEETGPNGRTLRQIAGTPYQSAAERDWFTQRAPQRSMQATQPQAIGPSTMATQVSANGATPPVSGPDVASYAAQYGVNPDTFARLLNHEGNGAWDTSEAGVQPARWGITQTTARSYGVSDTRQMSADQAYGIAADYLGKNLAMFGGDPVKAFASYFIGAGGVQEAVKQGGRNWVDEANRIAARYGYGNQAMTQYLRYLGLV